MDLSYIPTQFLVNKPIYRFDKLQSIIGIPSIIQNIDDAKMRGGSLF
jgi:hypothetical protein